MSFSDKLFLDVSSFQGYISQASFVQAKKDGIYGVVVKLTEGTSYVNPTAAYDVKNAKAAGLVVSVYHFARFSSASEAASEAGHFVSEANKLGLNKGSRMVLDIEVPLSGNMTANSQAFFSVVNKGGYHNTALYTYVPFMKAHLDSSKFPNKWLAGYPAKVDFKHPSVGHCSAWQYTDKLTLRGVSGKFDCSIDYAGLFTKANTVKVVAPKPAVKPAVNVYVSPDTYFVKSSFVNVYDNPGGHIVGKVDHNQQVHVVSVGKTWTQLKPVYVLSGGLSKSQTSMPQPTTTVKPQPKPVVKPASSVTAYLVTADRLFIRKEPSMTGQIVGTLAKNDQVEVESIANGWAKIKSNNNSVYVSAKYIKKK